MKSKIFVLLGLKASLRVYSKLFNSVWLRWPENTMPHWSICVLVPSKGQILDADGATVLYDLFSEFGVSQHTEIDFDLDNASPVDGAVKKKCHDIKRKIEDELGAQPYDHIHAFCGASFFDDLITHPEVKGGL